MLAERARLTEDPRQRGALWARVGELRLTLLSDLDGAAEAYREALDGAPDDALALSALESIEDRRGDWSTLQEVLLRRLGSASGADQVAVLLKLARNAEQKLSDVDQAVGFLRQLLDADPGNGFGYLELERILRAAERWYDLVDVLGKHADMEGDAGRQADRARAAGGDRQRLGEGSRLAGERGRGAGEGAGGRARQRRRAAVAGAGPRARASAGTTRARRSSARRPTRTQPAEIAEIHFRTPTILRNKEAEPAEIEAALLRAIDADAGAPPDAGGAGEDWRARSRTTSGWRTSSTCSCTRQPTTTSGAGCCGRSPGSTAAPWRSRRRRCPTSSGWWRSIPTEIPGREQLAEALIAAGRTDQATRIIGEVIAELTKARRGKDTARW